VGSVRRGVRAYGASEPPTFKIPKGIKSSAQGLRGNELPWGISPPSIPTRKSCIRRAALASLAQCRNR